MKHNFEAMVMTLVGFFVAALLVGSVLMPLVSDPSTPVLQTTNNVTSTGALNSTFAKNMSWATSGADTTSGLTATIAVAITRDPANATAIYVRLMTSDNGTSIVNLTNASGVQTINVPQIYLTNGTTRLLWNSTTTLANITVTSANMTWYKPSQQVAQGWSASSVALWAVVAIALIAVFVLFIFGRR